MDTFPIELWRLIINHLPLSAAINLSLTSRLFYNEFIDDIYYDYIKFDPSGYEPVRQGVPRQCYTTVERALAAGADPNQHVGTRSGNFLALATAVSRQDVAMVELLMRYGADPTAAVLHYHEYETPLTLAAMSGNCEIMEMFLKTEVETMTSHRGRRLMPAPKLPNVRNSRGETLLQLAVKQSNCAMVKLLLKHGARINARDSEGLTALMLAIKTANVENVGVLLEAGADLRLVCCRGDDAVAHALECLGWGEEQTRVFTAVITARFSSQLPVPGLCYGLTEEQVHQHLIDARPDQITTLTELGFSVDAKSRMGLTPLLVLCEHPELTILHDPPTRFGPEARELVIDALLNAGAETNIADPIDKSTPLIKTATWSSRRTTRLLLSKGARPEVIDVYGMTALAHAAWAGNVSTIDALLLDNQKCDSANERKSYHDLINKIVENDELDPPYSNLAGKTPLMLTTLYHERPLAAELLIMKGAEVDLRDTSGYTALAHAIRHDSINVAAVLVELGASMTTRADDGSTLLMQAAKTGSEKSVKWLLSQGVEVDEIATSTRPHNRETFTKETALTVAIRWGRIDVAAMLITFGASVETAFELDPGLVRDCNEEGDDRSSALLKKHGGHLGWLQ